MKHTRRNFIFQGSTGLGLAFASTQLPFFGSALAEASPTEAHFLLQLRMSGGWDVTLGTDPQIVTKLKARGIEDEDFFYLYSDSDIIDKNGILLGPAAAPIADYTQDIAFINGMMMIPTVEVHEPNRDYSCSGSVNSADPYMVAEIARATGNSFLGAAYKFERDQFKAGGLKPVIPIDQLLSSTQMPGSADKPALDLLGVINAFREGNSPLGTAQKLAVDASEKMKKMAELETQFINMTGSTSDKTKTVCRVLAAFVAGGVRHAACDITSDNVEVVRLDTHSNHKKDHPFALGQGFQVVADTLKLLKAIPFQPTPESPADGTLFDYTTVVVTSEFARTPHKEAGNDPEYAGTGHNQLNNSAMVFGKGIKGGQVIGASQVWSRKKTVEQRSRLQAQLFDYKLGRPASLDQIKAIVEKSLKTGQCGVGSDIPCVDYIYPENLWKTIAQGFGLKNGTPLVANAIPIPGLLKG